MKREQIKSVATFISVTACFIFLSVVFLMFGYLKILPWAVSNPKVISYVENVSSKSLKTNVEISNPVLKTEISPNLYFSVDKVKLSDKNKALLDIEDLNVDISFSKLLKKEILINKVALKKLYIDVNSILNLPVFGQKSESKSDWKVDIFNSVLSVDNSDIFYKVDKNTTVKLSIKDLNIDDNAEKKYIHYKVNTIISKGKNTLTVKTTDGGHVYILDKKKIVINQSKIDINNSAIYAKGSVDNNANYNITLSSKTFEIPAVIDLLNSQIVANNLVEQLVYFKDIDGNFDFNINASNKGINGQVDLNRLSFKLVPFSNLPILLNQGKVSFDNNNIHLKDFKGYYNGKSSNKMDFEGSVKDYLKSVDTDLVGNALVTNDFSTNYLSKMIGYPVQIKGEAATRVRLKSKYNKIDLVWLYLFKKGSGFVIDGEESVMNNLANRVVAAKVHFEDMLLDIKSIDYYAGNPDDNRPDKHIPILSMRGKIDFSNGETFIKHFGMELPKPMPSGFINLLAKQKFFKGGTFTGYIDVLNKKGCPPKIKADMKVADLRIPSQRLYIKSGEFKTDRNNMNISAAGKYRRSSYDLSGTILNEIKFPIVVKNIALSLDSVDVERYLKVFNAQKPTEVSNDVNAVIAESVEKGANIDENDDEDVTQTFDLANLIVEECILKVEKGFYKSINFSNVAANLSLDKNSVLKINTNKFDIAEGSTLAKINCDLKKHKYSIWLALVKVNSDIMASSLLNLSKEINGKASGLIELNTDESLKLNGRIRFRIADGVIPKIGFVEYAMKAAALFRNPLTMISPTVISDLVSIPEGRFEQIDGDLLLKDNVVQPMMIKSSAPQLSSYIVGTYNLENQDAALRIYTKFSNRRKGVYGFLRNLSLNSLANRIPLGSRNDSNYYESEISRIPPIDADEEDCQIFLTKVDGDIEHNNFLSSLKKIK